MIRSKWSLQPMFLVKNASVSFHQSTDNCKGALCSNTNWGSFRSHLQGNNLMKRYWHSTFHLQPHRFWKQIHQSIKCIFPLKSSGNNPHEIATSWNLIGFYKIIGNISQNIRMQIRFINYIKCTEKSYWAIRVLTSSAITLF